MIKGWTLTMDSMKKVLKMKKRIIIQILIQKK